MLFSRSLSGLLGRCQVELGFEIRWKRRGAYDFLVRVWRRSRLPFGSELDLRERRFVSTLWVLDVRARARACRQNIIGSLDVWLLRLALCEVILLSTVEIGSAQPRPEISRKNYSS